jgi:tetratricopeptide (TPR) repeat protein
MKDMFGSNAAGELLYCLKKYFAITTDEKTVSIHRSSQSIGLKYLAGILEKRDETLEKILSALTPYDRLEKNYADLRKLTPHLKALSENLDELSLPEDKKADFRIRLLTTIGNICRYKERSIEESIGYFKEALRLNDKRKRLNEREVAKLTFAVGEAAVLLNRNDEAEKYLRETARNFVSSKGRVEDLADNLRLLGILRMRRDDFIGANRCFDEAMRRLDERAGEKSVASAIIRAKTYAAKSMNYVNRYINKEEMNDAIDLMKRGIGVLEEKRSAKLSFMEKTALVHELADLKINLSGLENAVMRHEAALKLAEETEEELKKLPDEDNASYCALGKVYAEKGWAYLRMNKLKKAREMFFQARKICDKAQVNEYVWRTRMQQTETLVRLGELDEAYENCVYMFNLKDRERNIGGDLFYNTSYYHAAVVKRRLGDAAESLKYFNKFFRLMKDFCKEFLEKKDYERLMNENVFEAAADESEIKKCFENALKIFLAVCKKGSGFISDYVEKNFLDLS